MPKKPPPRKAKVPVTALLEEYFQDRTNVIRPFIRESDSLPGRLVSTCVYRENHATPPNKGDGSRSLSIDLDENWYHCFSCGKSGQAVNLLERVGVDVYEALDYIGDFVDRPPRSKNPNHTSIKVKMPTKVSTLFLDRGYPEYLLRRYKVFEGPRFVRGSKKPKTTTFIELSHNGEYVSTYYRQHDPRAESYEEGFDLYNYLYNHNDKDDFEEIILVEGFPDVFRMVQYDFENTYGTLGTSFTEGQMALLRKNRKLKRVVLAQDNDIAGITAKEKCYHMLKKEYLVLFAVFDKKDPGDSSEQEMVDSIDNALTYDGYSVHMEELLGDDYLSIQQQQIKAYKAKLKRLSP